MPLPKPQAALLFNNYFDNDSLSLLKQPLDIELILAGAYYNFVKGEGKELESKLDKKVPLPGSVSGSGYKAFFKIPNNGGHIPVQIYSKSDFVEITTDNINVADLFSEFKVTSEKTEGNKEITIINISGNLYAALDAVFSDGDEKLAVPFVAGKDESAIIQAEEPTNQGIPTGELGNLPAGAGQSDSSMTGGLESVQGTNIGQIFNDSTGVGAGAPGYNPMNDSGGTQPIPTLPELSGTGDEP